MNSLGWRSLENSASFAICGSHLWVGSQENGNRRPSQISDSKLMGMPSKMEASCSPCKPSQVCWREGQGFPIGVTGKTKPDKLFCVFLAPFMDVTSSVIWKIFSSRCQVYPSSWQHSLQDHWHTSSLNTPHSALNGALKLTPSLAIWIRPIDDNRLISWVIIPMIL